MSNLPTTTLDPSFLRRELHRKRKSFIVRGGSAGAAPGRTTRLLPGQKSTESPSPDCDYGLSALAELPSNPGMAIKEQGGSKIGYWILTAILVVIAVYVYFRK